MNIVRVANAARGSMRAATPSAAAARVTFLDNLRYLMVVSVVLYYAVAAYAAVAPHWIVHDTTTFAADLIHELFDAIGRVERRVFFVPCKTPIPAFEVRETNGWPPCRLLYCRVPTTVDGFGKKESQ